MKRRACVAPARLAAVAGLRAQAPQDVVLQRHARMNWSAHASLRVVELGPALLHRVRAVRRREPHASSATLGAHCALSAAMRYRLPRSRCAWAITSSTTPTYVGTDFFAGPRYDVEQLPARRLLRASCGITSGSPPTRAYKGAVEAISRKRAALKNSARDRRSSAISPTPSRCDCCSRLARAPMDEDAVDGARPEALRRLPRVPDVAHSSRGCGTGPEHALHRNIRRHAGSRSGRRYGDYRSRAAAHAADGMLLRDAVVIHSLDPDRLPRRCRAATRDPCRGART